MSETWSYGTRKLTSFYGSTSYQDISVAAGSSITPPAGRFIVALWMSGLAIIIEIYDYNTNWRQLLSPENSGLRGVQTAPMMLNSPFYCDGSTVRLRNTDSTREDVRYWYFIEDT